jgi:hypothetical protein
MTMDPQSLIEVELGHVLDLKKRAHVITG